MTITSTDILTYTVLALAILCFFAERRRGRLIRVDLEWRLDRYRRAVDDLDKWCGHEFPQARLIAAHLLAVGEGQGLNAGTPHADEPCTIDGTRQQLRRMAAKAS